jgi:hypothetical protein
MALAPVAPCQNAVKCSKGFSYPGMRLLLISTLTRICSSHVSDAVPGTLKIFVPAKQKHSMIADAKTPESSQNAAQAVNPAVRWRHHPALRL